MDPIRERLKNYLFQRNKKMAHLEREAGLSAGYLRNGKGALGTDKLVRILQVCPDLNGRWLLTGIGEMLICENERGEQNAPMNQRAEKITNIVRPESKYMVNEGNLELKGEQGFFEKNNALSLIEGIELDKVPENHQGLVREIKQRKLDFEQAKTERDVKQLKIEELTKEVLSDKIKIIELMEDLQRLRNQLPPK